MKPDVKFLQVAHIERAIQIIRTDDRVAIDCDGCGCFRGPTLSIDIGVADQGVDKTVCTAEISLGGVGEGSIALQHQSAIGHIGLESGGQVVAVHIVVVS